MIRSSQQGGRAGPLGVLAALAAFAALLVVVDVEFHAPLGIASGALYVIVVLSTLFMPRVQPFAVAAITVLLTLLALAKATSIAAPWVVYTNRLISVALQLAAAGAVAVYRRHKRESAALLAQIDEALGRVQVLEGLVPTCAWCKKIRDARGDWHSMEAYVAERTDAEFTHGICPDCVATLYATKALSPAGGAEG